MLLNVESLQKLAKDTTYPSRLEGVLNFRKNVTDKLQKRYFVLKGNMLFYYAKKSDKHPLGLILLEAYTVELSNELDGYCFQLLKRINSNNGNSNNDSPRNVCQASYTFMADDGVSLENWMTALTTCSYEHLKVTVDSLKEQIANLEPPEDYHPVIDESIESIPIVSTKRKSKTFAELHEQYAKQMDDLPKVQLENSAPEQQ